MKILTKTPDLLAQVQAFPELEGAPEEALQWLIDKSEYIEQKEGEYMFQQNSAVNYLNLILEGTVLVKFERNGELREFGKQESGTITGVLPFSRLKEARGFGQVIDKIRFLRLHRDYFVEMVNVSYELTQRFVAVMSDRVRNFTNQQVQNEKLMALGKLSAGLAHELNNPASAMVRSADELNVKIGQTPEKFKSVITMRITPEQTDDINAILFGKIENAANLKLSMLEKEDLKDDLLDWLEDHDMDDAEEVAEVFADFGFEVEDLDKVEEIAQGNHMDSLIWWIESSLSLEKLVSEIKISADRIAGLIKSIKTYSHMDRGSDREYSDINEGIVSTLTILKHKFKKKNIKLVDELDPNLPKANVLIGELNQVWTNIIDNALDAMDREGTLIVKSYTERDKFTVEIIDDGPGVPDDIKDRIWEPFYTTKGIGEGTGLGLDVVKKIIHRHRGDVALESEPGRTMFRFSIPVD